MYVCVCGASQVYSLGLYMEGMHLNVCICNTNKLLYTKSSTLEHLILLNTYVPNIRSYTSIYKGIISIVNGCNELGGSMLYTYIKLSHTFYSIFKLERQDVLHYYMVCLKQVMFFFCIVYVWLRAHITGNESSI